MKRNKHPFNEVNKCYVVLHVIFLESLGIMPKCAAPPLRPPPPQWICNMQLCHLSENLVPISMEVNMKVTYLDVIYMHGL